MTKNNKIPVHFHTLADAIEASSRSFYRMFADTIAEFLIGGLFCYYQEGPRGYALLMTSANSMTEED